jgi:hypothetical protein
MKMTFIKLGKGKRNWGKTCKRCLAKRGWIHLYKECI